jgi:glycine reductase
MHYLNQFFAGIGSEEKADVPVGSIEGAVGPGKRLQELLGDSAEIVVTVYCGDDQFAEHRDDALESILRIARDYNVKLLVAGPAFASGRYGFACAEVCHALNNSLDIDCVSGMHPENPGVETYKQYKDRRVYAFPTTEVVSGMGEALNMMAKSLIKLAAGSAISTPAEEGYIPRGLRIDENVGKSGAARAVSMLLDKLAGHPFITELPVEGLERIPVPPRITSLKNASLALVTSSGVIKRGNPDGFRGYQNTKWAKYSIEKMSSMLDGDWDVIHGGYNTEFMKRNPNYGIPLDVCREMEKEGVFAGLYPYYYVTPGARGLISVMHRIGGEIVDELKANGVEAVLMVST